MSEQSAAMRDVATERQRQVEQEGWSPKHDDEHTSREMAKAAACYALGKQRVTNLGEQTVNLWPWDDDWWKPADERRNLVKAGVLILAEIERLDRLSQNQEPPR